MIKHNHNQLNYSPCVLPDLGDLSTFFFLTKVIFLQVKKIIYG